MWVRVYIGGGYMHLIDFIEWLGLGEGVFFCTLFFAFCLVYLYRTCILSRFLCTFINTISYLSKKKVMNISLQISTYALYLSAQGATSIASGK